MPTSPNSKPRTPEQRANYRARLIAENRCANCAAVRAPGDTQTLCCTKCRARKNSGSNQTYAARRAASPPDFARAPETPFRYGTTRLNAPRRVTVTLDQETYDAINACRRNYCLSPAYEPYQVSEVTSTKPAPRATNEGRYDVALLNEVLEHIEPNRLPTVERVVFEFAKPRRVVVTTPNAEYNSVWGSLPAGKFRPADHRFEWTRVQF